MAQVFHDEPSGCEIVSVNFRDRDTSAVEVRADLEVGVVLTPDSRGIRGIGHGDEGVPWCPSDDPPEDAPGPVAGKTLNVGLIQGMSHLLQKPQDGCL